VAAKDYNMCNAAKAILRENVLTQLIGMTFVKQDAFISHGTGGNDRDSGFCELFARPLPNGDEPHLDLFHNASRDYAGAAPSQNFAQDYDCRHSPRPNGIPAAARAGLDTSDWNPGGDHAMALCVLWGGADTNIYVIFSPLSEANTRRALVTIFSLMQRAG
jgi:hypothetical protein